MLCSPVEAVSQQGRSHVSAIRFPESAGSYHVRMPKRKQADFYRSNRPNSGSVSRGFCVRYTAERRALFVKQMGSWLDLALSIKD